MEALLGDEARGALRLEAPVDPLHLGHVETATGIRNRSKHLEDNIVRLQYSRNLATVIWPGHVDSCMYCHSLNHLLLIYSWISECSNLDLTD